MPTYEFQCKSCEAGFEKILRLSEYNDPQVCPECKSTDTQRIVSACAFVLVGDGWPSKDLRCKGQMTRKNARMGKKMKDHVSPGETLAPNLNREETKSWAAAQKLAKDKGKNAASYEPMVQKEKRG